MKHTNLHDEWGIYRKTLFDLVQKQLFELINSIS
jgi:hypothetical protein